MGPSPAADATTVAASAAASSSGGSRPGIVRARRVLPEPGGPISNRPWPPARAISRPRRASACPRTSTRSGIADATWPPVAPTTAPSIDRPIASTSSIRGGEATTRCRRARTRSTASLSVWTPNTSAPSARHPSSTAAVATITRRTPRRTSAVTIGRMPGTGRTSPPSDSSPTSAIRPGAARTCSDPRRIPTAIARSSDAPALRRSAGARLTVIRRGGWTYPALRSAPRTRSRASWSAASARPTIVNPGNPGATSTSTRINRPSRPWSVADGTIASTPSRLGAGPHLALNRWSPPTHLGIGTQTSGSVSGTSGPITRPSRAAPRRHTG